MRIQNRFLFYLFQLASYALYPVGLRSSGL